MGKFVKVATTDEMANQPTKCIEVQGEKVALFKSDDAFCALSDTCTHRQAAGPADLTVSEDPRAPLRPWPEGPGWPAARGRCSGPCEMRCGTDTRHADYADGMVTQCNP